MGLTHFRYVAVGNRRRAVDDTASVPSDSLRTLIGLDNKTNAARRMNVVDQVFVTGGFR